MRLPKLVETEAVSSGLQALCRLSTTHSRFPCSGPQARIEPRLNAQCKSSTVGRKLFRGRPTRSESSSTSPSDEVNDEETRAADRPTLVTSCRERGDQPSTEERRKSEGCCEYGRSATLSPEQMAGCVACLLGWWEEMARS